MTGAAASFTVEYPCDRCCRAEMDLAGVHLRFTHRQMLAAAEEVHGRAHRAAAGMYEAHGVTVWSAEMAGVRKS